MPLPLGSKAPDFELACETGDRIRLHDILAERAVVLFFYPKDNTPGCTAESCAFRDRYEVFSQAGAEVLGVSRDAVASHRRFVSDHRLNFHVLADPDGHVHDLFRVGHSVPFLLPARETYVIDRDGWIRHHFSSQLRATKHVDEALRVVKRLAAERAG
ncbi:MAG: peroxiredoxin [Myxococcales bacterium]|nr:peroxiredoxin [Myxococcales bacterium]